MLEKPGSTHSSQISCKQSTTQTGTVFFFTFCFEGGGKLHFYFPGVFSRGGVGGGGCTPLIDNG